MIEEGERERPRRKGVLLWPVRFILRSLVKAIVLIVLGVRGVFRPRAVRFSLGALLVVGAIGWSFAGGSMQGPAQSRLGADPGAGVVSAPATAQLPPAPIVERYLKAQAGFNANGMWDTIGDEMKQQMQSANATPQQLQAQLDGARQQGRRYVGATYVGGMPIDGGSSVYFYVLSVDSPNGTTQVPYIYIVGPDGKIASIQ